MRQEDGTTSTFYMKQVLLNDGEREIMPFILNLGTPLKNISKYFPP